MSNFKVGDTVKVLELLGDDSTHLGLKVGSVGVVTGVNPNDDFVNVKFSSVQANFSSQNTVSNHVIRMLLWQLDHTSPFVLKTDFRGGLESIKAAFEELEEKNEELTRENRELKERLEKMSVILKTALS
jgi:hypothetical protein